MVGDDVITVYGRGRIIGLNTHTHTVIVELVSWRLAQRSTVKCYLDMDQVQVVRTKTLHEMDQAWERVQYAQECKRQATEFFASKNYEQALACYMRAVDAVRHVQHDANSSNETRADLVLVMVTCCNNAATCCIHLQKYDLAIQYAQNALVLINALYENRGLKIHSILRREGLSDAKLFGEYKVKALLMIAKGLAERGEYASAMDSLKQAKDTITVYTKEEEEDSSSRSQLLSQQKQVQRLYASCVQGKKALKVKEKQRAQAMFASPTKDTEKDKHKDANPVVTPSPEATSKEDETDEELEEISEPGSEIKPRSEEFLVEQDGENEEETPWYEEHKEALVLSAVAGLAVLSVVLLRSHRK
jgi:tetratricopeptide (TPR) repeat protein